MRFTAKPVDDTSAPAFTADRRTIFLEALAHSSNVTESAKSAGVSTSAVYRARRKSKPFRTAWQVSLCEGYTRLEAELLAEALRAVTAKTHETTLKSRAQKQRLGLQLLSQHRSTVRGQPAPRVARSRETTRQIKARLEARFAEIELRLTQGGDNDDA